jgi:DNA-binding NtrC family response regulator
MSAHRILVVDDEEGIREVVVDSLERIEGCEVVEEADPLLALDRVQAEPFDLLITDIRMPGMSGVELLRAAREHDPQLPVLLITGYPTVETAVEALRLGAVDYLTKPFLPEDLLARVRRTLDERRLREENALLERQVHRGFQFEELIGRSKGMLAVFDVIDRISETDVDVLIQGETGTGKELVARALHKRSKRRGNRFVPVDCGAIPENLMESEFFGHEKGSFTGAAARSIGLLEYATGGSVFLDELGELPLMLQAKLLRALQERKIRRVGGKIETPVDLRVIAASAKDLDKAIVSGGFRQDLYFRINVVAIQIPPLRERKEDIPLLAEHFLRKHGEEMQRQLSAFSAQALEVLAHYPWPGNVRELQNAVRHGIALSRNSQLDVEDLPERVVAGAGECAGRDLSPQEFLGDAPPQESFFETRARHTAAFEERYLSRLLESHDGDVRAAAVAARIPRGTCYRLLKNHGLVARDFKEGEA